MKIIKPSLVLGVLCLLSMSLNGCMYVAPVMPPQGLLFSNIAAPIDTDAESTPTSSKVGESSTSTVLGLFSFGDASLDTAARNGNLTKIEYIDYTYLNVLGLFQQFTIRAHGE
jgi:hypothetical protein